MTRINFMIEDDGVCKLAEITKSLPYVSSRSFVDMFIKLTDDEIPSYNEIIRNLRGVKLSESLHNSTEKNTGVPFNSRPHQISLDGLITEIDELEFDFPEPIEYLYAIQSYEEEGGQFFEEVHKPKQWRLIEDVLNKGLKELELLQVNDTNMSTILDLVDKFTQINQISFEILNLETLLHDNSILNKFTNQVCKGVKSVNLFVRKWSWFSKST